MVIYFVRIIDYKYINLWATMHIARPIACELLSNLLITKSLESIKFWFFLLLKDPQFLVQSKFTAI